MPKSRIQIGKVVTIKGQKFKISAGVKSKYTAKSITGKKRTINFGAKGYKVGPGTPRGNNYCARSSGIKSKSNEPSANDFARMLWNCEGKISKKR